MAGLSAGLTQSCAYDAGGAAVCWGVNRKGSLGTSDTTTAMFVPPTAVAGGLSFTALSVSRHEALSGNINDRVCGLVAGGDAYCWGDNSSGQLGTGSADTLPHAAPELVVGGHHFSQIAAGPTTCGLELNGSIYCWGWNGQGVLGIGSTDTLPHPTPTLVPGTSNYVQITVGQHHACGRTSTNAVFCWGENFSGELGSNDGLPHYSPTPVVGAPPFTSISAGLIATCGVTAQRDVWCWGGNSEGEIGDGTTTARPTPTLVDP